MKGNYQFYDSSPMAICARDRKAVMLSSLKIDQHGPTSDNSETEGRSCWPPLP